MFGASMFGMLEELRGTMADPAMRHAALVHVPVAMASLGVIVALVAAIARRSRTPRVVAIVWFAGLAASSFLGVQSGEDAEGALSATLPAAAFERVAKHAEMAERIWLLALGVATLFALSLLRDRLIRAIASALALGLAIGTAGWTGVAAHHGGILVYEFGAGTALSQAPAAPRAGATLGSGTEQAPGPGSMPGPEPSPGQQPALSEDPNPASGVGSNQVGAPAASGDGAAVSADPRIAFFDEAVLPLLAAHCQACHNSVRPKARLDLTSAAGLLAGGRSGLATVVPGRPEESLLIAVVKGQHPDIDPMPPDEELSAEEVAMLERWIREGAVWGGFD